MKQGKSRRRAKKKTRQGFESFLVVARNLLDQAFLFLHSTRVQRRMRRMQLVERLSLSNKHSISLVRIDSHEFVIGCTGESMVLLGMREPQQEAVLQTPTKEDLVQAFGRIQ
jgi:flagellar biogenesis protein FliO